MSGTLELGRLDRDALREVANISSGHAATALGQMIERRIMITAPTFAVGTVREIPELLGYRAQPVVVVSMEMLGDVTGTLAFLTSEPRARRLSAMLLGRGRAEVMSDPLARSSLTEAANILGGAYASAIATLMGGVVMLSVPSFGIEPPDRVFEEQRRQPNPAQLALCIETRLTADECSHDYGGHIVLLPDPAALLVILESLRAA